MISQAVAALESKLEKSGKAIAFCWIAVAVLIVLGLPDLAWLTIAISLGLLPVTIYWSIRHYRTFVSDRMAKGRSKAQAVDEYRARFPNSATD